MPRPRITFVGHSTVLFDFAGTRLLTDPWLRSRLLGLRRAGPPPPDADSLGPLDAILVTHAHADHLDPPTLRRLPRVPLCIPAGMERYVGRLGFPDVRALSLWESTRVGKVEVTAVPTQHLGGRYRARPDGVCSFVLEGTGLRALFVGDVDMKPSGHFDEIGRRFAIDVALLPVGGMLPLSFYEKRRHKPTVHADPATVLDLFQRCGARCMIPIHWGTLTLGLGPRDQSVRRLLQIARERGIESRIAVIEHGGTFES